MRLSLSMAVRMTEKKRNHRRVAPSPKTAPYAIAHPKEGVVALSVIMVTTGAHRDMDKRIPVRKREICPLGVWGVELQQDADV